jgi:hypothetical protein
VKYSNWWLRSPAALLACSERSTVARSASVVGDRSNLSKIVRPVLLVLWAKSQQYFFSSE